MIDQKKFAVAALALNKKAFIIDVIYLESKILIYLACKAEMTLLLVKNVDIPKEYGDFSNVFFKKPVVMFPNYSNINKHIINAKLSKQLPYRPIYS